MNRLPSIKYRKYHTFAEEHLNRMPLKKRKFLMLRIAGFSTLTSKNLCKISRGVYNSFFRDRKFTLLYQRLPELRRSFGLIVIDDLKKLYSLERLVTRFSDLDEEQREKH